jgi:lysine 2,3-aminomutase
LERFSVALTDDMLALIDARDPNDPIAAQFVPRADELDVREVELPDPIGDDAHSPLKGITHRYPDRVLLKPLHVCPVYCRFCFRREVVGPEGGLLTAKELDAALDYIARHTEIWEVILTGGDPLLLSDRRLAQLLARLASIEHVCIVRVHTRVPVVQPARVTPELAQVFATRLTPYIVLHTNHPRELTTAALAACARFVDAGIPMLSQTVLLRGVNADAATLEQLFRALVRARVKPYYLHHPDLAQGTGHFRTTIESGRAVVADLRGRISGLCQPTYVLDIPSGHGKVPLEPAWVSEPKPDGSYDVRDPDGRRHRYGPDAEGSSEGTPISQVRPSP